VTCVEGRGVAGPVRVVLTVVPRKELANVTAIVRGFDADAFYSVDDVQAAARGVFPAARKGVKGLLPSLFSPSRQPA
jgi:hypothetical protein